VKEKLLELLETRPFIPFMIVTSGGEKYESSYPTDVAVGKHFATLVDPETDRHQHIYLLPITNFEVANLTAPL